MPRRNVRRLTKPLDQIRKEAHAAAVEDLQAIIAVVHGANCGEMLGNASGSAGLLAVAHALYHEHKQRLEIDATEYDVDGVDASPVDGVSLGEYMTAPIRGRIVRGPHSRPRYPEPEPPPSSHDDPICVQCGQAVSSHAAGDGCPAKR